MKKVKKIHEKLGQDTLIVLLNGRATATQTIMKKKIEKNNEEEEKITDWISEEFLSVFNYAPPNLSGKLAERDLLLYHEIDDKWYIAEKIENKGGIGGIVGSLTSSGFKTLWEGDNRPSDAEIESILLAPPKTTS